jgi:flagellar assembly protein FliH
MQKFRESDIKPFQFSDLNSGSSSSEFKAFNFPEVNGEVFKRQSISEDTIRSERTSEQKNNFKIDDIVREYRGLSRQDQSDLEKRIQEEVQKRLEQAYKEAFAEGLAQGKEQGAKEAFVQYEHSLSNKIEDIASVLESVQIQANGMLENNKKEVYEFIKRFSKWIVLKEIDSKNYLSDLLEKLILELNNRRNLIVKVGKANFEDMPAVIEAVESRLGKLSNVRVEIVPEIIHPGIILEGENGLIDGSLEGVFQNIDKIFEQIIPDAKS